MIGVSAAADEESLVQTISTLDEEVLTEVVVDNVSPEDDADRCFTYLELC